MQEFSGATASARVTGTLTYFDRVRFKNAATPINGWTCVKVAHDERFPSYLPIGRSGFVQKDGSRGPLFPPAIAQSPPRKCDSREYGSKFVARFARIQPSSGNPSEFLPIQLPPRLKPVPSPIQPTSAHRSSSNGCPMLNLEVLRPQQSQPPKRIESRLPWPNRRERSKKPITANVQPAVRPARRSAGQSKPSGGQVA